MLLSHALSLSTYVWDPTGNLLVTAASHGPHELHLCYTGRHYMVVCPKQHQVWRARVSRWCSKASKAMGFGGMNAEKTSNAASVKYRIAQKLTKEGVTDAAALIGIPWDKGPTSARAIKGTAREVKESAMRLAADLQVSHTQGHWQQQGQLGEDKLQQNDPWGKWFETKGSLTPNEKLSKVQLKTSFVRAEGEVLQVRSFSDLLAAKGQWSGIVCVSHADAAEALANAISLSGSVVILSRTALQNEEKDIVYKRMQLVSRSGPLAEWKAAEWHTYSMGPCSIEASLPGITVSLEEPTTLSVVAELREQHVDSATIVKFAKSESLEAYGLEDKVFQVVHSRCWGHTARSSCS